MASGDKEKPQCRICKTVFTFKGPEPLLLPCLHPACKPCVDSKEENITCTKCQQLFLKTDHAFPKHFLLSKDLFQSVLKNSPSDIICTNRSDGAKAETWCAKCEAFLCLTCQEYHRETKATRSHVAEPLKSYFDPGNNISKTYGQCETHQGYLSEVFDSKCKCWVCYKCLRNNHSTCSVEDIDEAFDKMKQAELDNNIKQIVARLADITGMERQAQDLTKKLEENSKQVKDDVINTFSDLRATLDMREKMLLQEASQSFKEVQNVNAKRIEVLKLEKTRCEAALQFIERSKEISDPVQALTMKKTIDKRMRVCTEADLMKIDDRESSICLSTHDLQDVKHSIETFAGLVTVNDQETWEKAVSGPTTQEKQNKKLKELEKKRKAYHQTLEDIPCVIASKYKFTDKENNGWGCSTMISKKELQDPLKGFAKDDCVHVSVDVEVFKTSGLLSLDELIKKKCSEALARGLSGV